MFAGRDSNTGKSHSLPDRIDSLCSRAINWAALAKKKKAEKKLAITVSDSEQWREEQRWCGD